MRPPHLPVPLNPHAPSPGLHLRDSSLEIADVLKQLLDPWLVVPVKPCGGTGIRSRLPAPLQQPQFVEPVAPPLVVDSLADKLLEDIEKRFNNVFSTL